jgi:glycine cleavage system H protein
MSSQEIRDDRRYTSDHEWAFDDGEAIVIGITAYAVEQLGDITMVNIDLAVGEELEPGTAFGTVESVKTLADLFAPISGKIARINAELEEEPERVNDDCYGEGWLIAIEASDKNQLQGLLDAAAYKALLIESH